MKTIALPGLHDLDITPIVPILDSKIFQRLRLRKQLGASYVLFPCANHTRFVHALGTYSLTLERLALWQRDGVISENTARDLALFGLLHDIGHGPYSHATEPLYEASHNAQGLKILSELSTEIIQCGGNLTAIYSLFKRDDPHAACVSHRTLGTDKLDYLTRDAQHTTEAVGFRLGDILNHTSYLHNQLAVDIKFVSEVMQLQRNYVEMHDRVYFRKASIIAQYFLRQIVAQAIATSDVDPLKLPTFRDCDLDAALLQAQDPLVRGLFDRFLNRDLPKAAIIIRAEGVKTLDRNHGKLNAIFRLPLQHLLSLTSFENRSVAAQHESAIAEIAGIPAEAVLVTPVPSIDRFKLDTVYLQDGGNSCGTLAEFRPKHYESLEETTRAYASVMVCVRKEYREHVASTQVADTIFNYIVPNS